MFFCTGQTSLIDAVYSNTGNYIKEIDLNFSKFIKQGNFYISPYFFQSRHFETLYSGLREKEQRAYSDDMVISLPDIAPNHLHYDEWQVRKASYKRLTRYLASKNKPLQILEVGCGNGWLSHQIAGIPQTSVIGLDINSAELEQASRVFAANNLNFILGDLQAVKLLNTKFDIILFAASMSYFSSLNETVRMALEFLTSPGEIHIIDSFFYDEKEVGYARQRSNKYFEDLEFPEMSDHFHHHTLQELQNFSYILLQKKKSLWQILSGQKIVFPWICIKSNE